MQFDLKVLFFKRKTTGIHKITMEFLDIKYFYWSDIILSPRRNRLIETNIREAIPCASIVFSDWSTVAIRCLSADTLNTILELKSDNYWELSRTNSHFSQKIGVLQTMKIGILFSMVWVFMWEYSDEMNILFAWKYAARKVDTISFIWIMPRKLMPSCDFKPLAYLTVKAIK